MKVLLINGSPRKNGNTFTALSEIAKTLQSEGLETEIVWIGNKPIRGCIACGTCKTKANLPKRRCYSSFRGTPDAAPDDEYAAGYFAVLEHRLRP